MMISSKAAMSILIGAATLLGTMLPVPALAKNTAAQNAALDQMAMQMYLQQQANTQNQALLSQQQAQANLNAGNSTWAAQQYWPVTGVNYAYQNPYGYNGYNGNNSYDGNNRYNGNNSCNSYNGYVNSSNPYQNAAYQNHFHHDFRRAGNHDFHGWNRDLHHDRNRGWR
jgi:hypothetical protein